MIRSECFISTLYGNFFNQAPCLKELKTWNELISHHHPLNELKLLAYKFSHLEKFTNTYGKLNNFEFVQSIFHNAQGMHSDLQQMLHWEEHLNKGMTRSEMVLFFTLEQYQIDFNKKTLTIDEHFSQVA